MKIVGMLAALGLAASSLAACSGGTQVASNGASAIPAAPVEHAAVLISPQMRDAKTGRVKHVFFSRRFLREHPGVAIGPNVRPEVASANNLIYGGGPVQLTPKVYLVFWGFTGANDATHDPDGMASYLVNFFNAIGSSSWLNTDTQYYQTLGGTQDITNPTGQLAGTWYDSSGPLPVYTDSDVASEAVKAVAHFGFSANANYVVVTPTHTLEPGFIAEWCAYHSTTASGANTVAYTDLPYQPDAMSSCGVGSVNSPGTLDGASIVGGHEESETQTDPGAGNGWVDSSGSEIGDKCAWTGLQNTSFPNGSTFPTQPLWSNATASCVQSY